MKRLLTSAARLLIAAGRLLIFSAALWILYLELGRFVTGRILTSLADVSPVRSLLALTFLLISYLMAAVTEALAASYAGASLKPPQALLSALVTVGITGGANFGLLRAGNLRDRLYRSWGLSGYAGGKALAFTVGSFALGHILITALGLLTTGELIIPGLSLGALRLIGALLSSLLPLYLLFTSTFQRGVRVSGLTLSLPRPRLAALQAGAGLLNWLAGAVVLFLLLPAAGFEEQGVLLAAYGIAMLAGVLSGLPGGLGVFEAVFLLLTRGTFTVPVVAGALIAYRLLYFFLPLIIGLLALILRERSVDARRIADAARRFGRGLSSILPSMMTLAVFLLGVLLLFSGATPVRAERIEGILDLLPLPLLEVSHLLASLLGLLLLFLARGLQRRLMIAWATTAALLLPAMAATITRGGSPLITGVIGLLFLALLSLRHHFYRRARILSTPMPGRWALAIVLVLLATGWLTVFANRPVSLNRFLWIEVSAESDVARSLRALGGAVGVSLLLFMVRTVSHRLLPSPGRPTKDSPIIRRIIAESSASYANLALLGDKEFLLDETQTAFIMYAQVAGALISMGDPIGPRQRWPELVWKFRELAERAGRSPLFYEVSGANLSLYEDLGLTALPIGEEAIVDLDRFTLSGRENHDLRSARNRMRREGWEVRILEPEELSAYLPELREVSQRWLAAKGSKERGFALGTFDPSYLAELPIAVVERNGAVIAFANLWETGDLAEASIDLMRHLPDAPSQTMDFLFAELLEGAAARGFRTFNLGLAPLSGMEQGELAPVWRRLAGLLFRYGENFYSFQGLRSYKEKFHPRWQTKYLASPGGLGVIRALFSLTRLPVGKS